MWCTTILRTRQFNRISIEFKLFYCNFINTGSTQVRIIDRSSVRSIKLENHWTDLVGVEILLFSTTSNLTSEYPTGGDNKMTYSESHEVDIWHSIWWPKWQVSNKADLLPPNVRLKEHTCISVRNSLSKLVKKRDYFITISCQQK